MGALIVFLIMVFIFGVAYPVAGLIYYKLIKRSKKSIGDILDEDL